jgi:HSP20 family protein
MVIRISGSNQNPNQQDANAMASSSPFRLFEDYLNNWFVRNAMTQRQERWRPPVDVLERGNNLIIRTEIPGVDEKDIELKLDGRTLTIRGERKAENEESGCCYHRIESSYGTFSRSFDLPDSVDAEKISAAYANGVISITIPQKPEIRPRTIKITKQ